MSPNPATCNPVMSSRIPTILGPLEMLTRILIPNSKIGAVIGKGGSIIKKIRESSGAKITICGSCAGAPGVGENNTADDSGDRMVTIAGLYLAVLSAFQAIVSQTEPGFGKRGTDEPTRGGGGHSNSGSICVRLLVPNSRAGGLIGRGGSTIRVIREQSCARIEISSHGLYIAGGGLLDRIVAITGTFSACIRAYQMICLQLANIPNLGTLATSLTSQDDVVPGNSGTVHGGGMANTPTSQIHEQTWLGHQQQRVGCGIGVYHGNMALQPVPQVGSPFHVPPGSSPRALQSELPKLSSPSGYVPPTILSNIAPDQGRGGHRSDTSPTSSLGCLPHSLNGNGRRRSSSTPDNYYSSSHPSFISDFTADVIRNVGLKDNRNTFNASTAASVPINRDASPAPIKITVDMDIPYEALTAMRLDHGFSNIMNISGAVLEELQTTPVSTWSGLHSNVDVKGGDAIERVEELDVEEFNSQECDSGRKDKCKDEGDQSSDPLDQQEGSLPSEWRHDTCTENSSLCSNVSFTNCISTKSLGDSSSSKSSLSSLKDNATLNGKCTSSSNRISITGTLEVKVNLDCNIFGADTLLFDHILLDHNVFFLYRRLSLRSYWSLHA